MPRWPAGAEVCVCNADGPRLVPAPRPGYNLGHDGGVAQLVRACGSYPQCRWFESTRRYHTSLGSAVGGACLFMREARRLNGWWAVAGLLGLTAGTLTWIIGFPLAAVAFAASLPTTTLALLLGLGGYLMWDRRHRRWSWSLVLVALIVGPFVRGASKDFMSGPLEIGAVCLLAALVASATTRRPKSAPTEGGDDDPEHQA